MGGGGKGGKSVSETKVRLPKEIEEAARQNLDIANEVSALGYVPYAGNTVAALTPMQMQAMDTTAGARGAFGMSTGRETAQIMGLDPYTGMQGGPVDRGGVRGYSPMSVYEHAKGEIPEAQRRMIDSFTINPHTGAAPTNPTVPAPQFTPDMWGMDRAQIDQMRGAGQQPTGFNGPPGFDPSQVHGLAAPLHRAGMIQPSNNWAPHNQKYTLGGK